MPRSAAVRHFVAAVAVFYVAMAAATASSPQTGSVSAGLMRLRGAVPSRGYLTQMLRGGGGTKEFSVKCDQTSFGESVGEKIA